MTIGWVLVAVGVVQIIWMIRGIRTYDPDKISRIDFVLHDITRTSMRPKAKWEVLIERYSYWYGLVMGVIITAVGLIFANME